MSPSSSGSSPLARGLLTIRRKLCQLVRIIPARAGFTSGCAPETAPARDHPRSRGVYAVLPVDRGGGRGSSPLARGLPYRAAPMVAQAGIIPARAGFTSAGMDALTLAQDHPRSRGVYTVGVAPAARR